MEMIDSRDATCGARCTGWTRERPTEPGYYWTRNVQHNRFAAGIVEVYKPSNSLYVMVMGDDCDCRLASIVAEWYGPILPPD